MIRRSMILAVLPLALVAAAAPQSQDGERSATVSTAGLDLRTPAGETALDRRIDRAIDMMCRANGTRGLNAVQGELRCRETARASAAPQVASAVSAARGGRSMAANADVTVRAK